MVCRQILAEWKGRVFQTKFNDMQHDASHTMPHCLNCDVSLRSPEWTYSYCRLGASGGNQSKWPVDKVHHVISAASAHQSYIPGTEIIFQRTPPDMAQTVSMFKFIWFNCTCVLWMPNLTNIYCLFREALSYRPCLANECDGESLTQGEFCSQRLMHMFTLHPVLHHSSQLATVPWSNSGAHIFQGVMGWLPLLHAGMSYSSPVWYCGWSLSHWFATKTLCNFRPIEPHVSPLHCLKLLPSIVSCFFFCFYLWPCKAQRLNVE